MLTSTVLPDTNIVTASYDGSLGTEEMATLRRQLETVIATHGQARLLMVYGDIDLGRIEPKALWEDLKTAGALTDVDKVAVVTDSGWVQKLTSVAGMVAPVTVKVFTETERQAALEWLRA